MFTDLHTAARLRFAQTATGLGLAFARPWVADRAAPAVGGACPIPAVKPVKPVKRTRVGMSRGDPAPS